MSEPDLEHLRTELAGLASAPVTLHPGVLDEVHRALVGELDRLARTAESSPLAAPSGGA